MPLTYGGKLNEINGLRLGENTGCILPSIVYNEFIGWELQGLPEYPPIQKARRAIPHRLDKGETDMVTKTIVEDVKVPFLKKITEFDKDGEKGIIKFALRNGEVIRHEVGKQSAENAYHLRVHGASQKIGDAAAEYSKTNDFGGAFAEMNEISELMYSTDWSRTRAGGISKQVMDDLIAALAKMKKLDVEVITAAVTNATPETIKQWQSNKAVNLEISNIRKLRADALKKASTDTIDDVDLGEGFEPKKG